MKVHHINCGTLCPASSRLASGEGSLFARARFVSHCLLIESKSELILVDTGLGTRDIEDPRSLGRSFLRRSRPRLDPAETALAHVERLGFQRRDVRHLVPTHLDLDHAGGLADFPEALVHVFEREFEASSTAATNDLKYGYRPIQWAHGPRWSVQALDGDHWLGFSAVRIVPGTDAEVLLVPLLGHTRGHCGVAVKTQSGWLLHAGDAYFTHHELDLVAPYEPLGSRLFQRWRSSDNTARRDNVARLRQLLREHPEVEIFSAHSSVQFDRLAASCESLHPHLSAQ